MLSVHASGARRLTGPGPLLGGPGAALDLTGPPTARGEAAVAWAGHASALLSALGWGGAPVTHAFTGGTSLAVPAPPDLLYTAAGLVEAAWAAVETGMPPDADALRAQAADDAEPVLVALEAAARAHGVSYLRGDDLVSLGHGAHGQAWPEDAPPAPEGVAWDVISDVPVALVTGTNGKTTTVRMLAAILAAAGHVPAFTTTDSITVGGEVLETGDCSGPQSARRALRHPATTAAALEIARGGLLRRGLPLPRATAAAVTNVDADHLGEYGIETVEELAAVKFAVHHALTAGGLLVTSADDPLSLRTARALLPALDARGVALGLVALRPDHPAFEGHPGPVASIVEGHLAVRDGAGGAWAPLVAAEDVPSSHGGRAAYNLRNALTAALLARALGVEAAAIARGLRRFRGDATDNPGRGNVLAFPDGMTALVDFAHNAHGFDALGAFAWSLPARRRLVLLSQPGDRRDAEIIGFARAAARLGADRYVVTDLPQYLRGREPGALPAMLRGALETMGISADRIEEAADPLDGVRHALAWAGPGDLLLLPILSDRTDVLTLLQERADAPAS